MKVPIIKYRLAQSILLVLVLNDVFGQPDFKIWEAFGIGETISPEAILQDSEGFLWLGTRTKGLLRFDGQSIYTFNYEQEDPKSINSNYVTTLQEWQNYIIGGTKADGWFILDKKTYKVDRFTNATHPSIMDQRIEDILVQGDSLYVCTYNGLCIHNLKNNIITCYPIEEGFESDRDALNTLMCIEPNPLKMNEYFLGSTAGLLTFDVSTKRYIHIRMPDKILNTEIKDQHGPLQLQVRDIAIDHNSTLYMVTWGGGLLMFDLETYTWDRIDFETGYQNSPRALSHNIAENVYWYHTDTLLISTRNQIHSYTPSSRTLEVLAVDDKRLGYYNYDFLKMNNGSHIVTNDKTLLITKPTGDLRYDHLIIDHVVVNEDIILPRSQVHKGINLQGGPNNLFVHFSSPRFNQDDTVQFRLTKSMSQWQNTNRNTLFLNEVNSNDVLQIRTNAGSVIIIPITVYHAFYTRWWFYPSLVLMAAVLIAGFWWMNAVSGYKTAKLAREYELKLSEMEMQTLRAQMNPHFLFNSLNAIKYFSLTKSPYETADYISKFSLLIRKILHNSTQKILPLDQELESLKLYLEVESLRFTDKFDYQVDIDPTLQLSEILIPPLILQPFVENAIWHGLMHLGQKGRLMIQISNEVEHIKITVEDNGIGREKSKAHKSVQSSKGKSYGLEITKSRIDLIEKTYHVKTNFWIDDLKDADGNASGTRVTLIIPKIVNQ